MPSGEGVQIVDPPVSAILIVVATVADPNCGGPRVSARVIPLEGSNLGLHPSAGGVGGMDVEPGGPVLGAPLAAEWWYVPLLTLYSDHIRWFRSL